MTEDERKRLEELDATIAQARAAMKERRALLARVRMRKPLAG